MTPLFYRESNNLVLIKITRNIPPINTRPQLLVYVMPLELQKKNEKIS